MKLHIAQIPKLILKRRASAILGMVIIAMLWGGLLVNYRDNVRQDFRDAERRNQNYTMLFEENVLRSIGEIDKALLYLRRSVENGKDSVDYQTIVNTTDVLSEIIVQVAIINSKGISRASNATPRPSGIIDISDREHFRVHVDSREDRLFISKPVIGRASGKWSVQFTRRFSNKDGSFAGIVVASMDPAHFTNFYDKIDLGSTTSVAMIGGDGVVRASGGGTAGRLPLGHDISGSPLFSGVEGADDAARRETASFTDRGLLVTSNKVRGYPLWVTISTEASEIYQASWSNLQRNAVIVGAFTLLVLIALEQILRAEDRAAQKARQLQLTLEHISQGIMLVTKNREIPIINKRAGELLNLPRDVVESRDPAVAFAKHRSPDDDLQRAAIEPPKPRGPQAGSAEPSIVDYQRSDGTFIEVRKTLLPDGAFVQTFTDITTRREAEAYIARLASEDPLTGLPNRRVFRATLEELISRHASAAADGIALDAEFALLFLDMDRFKVVNDTLGHRIGDMLLLEVARRLKAVLRPSDMLARLGGDEFAVLLTSVVSNFEIETLANGLIEAIAQPFRIDHHLIRSSISIGIAICPRDGATTDELLVAADLALYAVKTERRGLYRFYQKALNDEVNQRRQIEEDLRDALQGDQLELHYQPVFDLRRNRITGFEALARWRHPEKGAISPATFIPVAEDCGLILPLGEWALAQACRTAVRWPSDLNVAVNLSPVQLSSELLNTIVRILDETGLQPGRLTLEITERTFLEDSEKTLSILHELRKLGVRISLDDFGTGYSSLSYLRSFPFDTIKIDRTFVQGISADTGSSVIVQAVILIAGGLGMRTIAEGVETEFQQQILKALGCDEVQGFRYSRAVPGEDVPALITEWLAKSIRAA